MLCQKQSIKLSATVFWRWVSSVADYTTVRDLKREASKELMVLVLYCVLRPDLLVSATNRTFLRMLLYIGTCALCGVCDSIGNGRNEKEGTHRSVTLKNQSNI